MAKRLDVAEFFAYEAARLVNDPDYGGDQVVSALYLQTEQLWLKLVQVSNFMRTARLQAGAMMPAPGNCVTQDLEDSSPFSSIGIEMNSSVELAQLSDPVRNARLQAEATMMMTAPGNKVTQNLPGSSSPSSSIAGIERSSSVEWAQLSDLVGNAHLQAEAMMTAPRTYVTQNLLSSFPAVFVDRN
ncbi:unnamed protein product [Calypogeia fissa]